MSPKKSVDFDHGPAMSDFMRGVQRTLAEQSDFRGIGGHGLEAHGPHGPHSQTNIGIGDTTVNFRELKR